MLLYLLTGFKPDLLLQQVLPAKRHRFERPSTEGQSGRRTARSTQTVELEAPVSRDDGLPGPAHRAVGIVERHARLPGARRRRRSLEDDPAGCRRAPAHHDADRLGGPAADADPRAAEELILRPRGTGTLARQDLRLERVLARRKVELKRSSLSNAGRAAVVV